MGKLSFAGLRLGTTFTATHTLHNLAALSLAADLGPFGHATPLACLLRIHVME
jgi:hypothetical protein